MTYYAVAKGRTPGFYLTWKECKLQVHKFGGAKYKGFQTLEEANEYYKIHHPGPATEIISKKKPKSPKSTLKPKRICLCCEKPFGGRAKLCPTCRKVTSGISQKNFFISTEIGLTHIYIIVASGVNKSIARLMKAW